MKIKTITKNIYSLRGGRLETFTKDGKEIEYPVWNFEDIISGESVKLTGDSKDLLEEYMGGNSSLKKGDEGRLILTVEVSDFNGKVKTKFSGMETV